MFQRNCFTDFISILLVTCLSHASCSCFWLFFFLFSWNLFLCLLLSFSEQSFSFQSISHDSRNFRENKSSEERIRKRKDSLLRQQQKLRQVMIVVSAVMHSLYQQHKQLWEKAKDNKSLISNPRVASCSSSFTSFPFSSSVSVRKRMKTVLIRGDHVVCGPSDL